MSRPLTEVLLRWSECARPRVLFDSDCLELTSEVFWACVRGRRNVAIVVDVDGNVFGSFHPAAPLAQDTYSPADPRHFVFTFRNAAATPPLMFRLRDGWDGELLVYGNDQHVDVFGIRYAFYISTCKQSFVRTTFYKSYAGAEAYGNTLFIGSAYPTFFDVTRVVAVELGE